MHWLTFEGTLLSYFQGAAPDQLLKYAKIALPKKDNELIQLAMEMADLTDKSIRQQVYFLLLEKKSLKPMDIAFLTARLLLEKEAVPTREQFKRGMNSLKQKHPEFYDTLRTGSKGMFERAQELDEVIGSE